MAIVGIGIDAIELNRIKKVMTSSFVQRILTDREQVLFGELSQKRQVEFLAGRFAAKEAFSKAIGTGIGKNISFQEIEVLNNDAGQPHLTSPYPYITHVSISHTNHDAYAIVTLEE